MADDRVPSRDLMPDSVAVLICMSLCMPWMKLTSADTSGGEIEHMTTTTPS